MAELVEELEEREYRLLDVELWLAVWGESQDQAGALAIRICNQFLGEVAAKVPAARDPILMLDAPVAEKDPKGLFMVSAVLQADVPADLTYGLSQGTWAWRDAVRASFYEVLEKNLTAASRAHSRLGPTRPGVRLTEADAEAGAVVEAAPKKLITIKVNLSGRDNVIDIPENGNLLDCALEKDVQIGWSCKAGVCDSCKVLIKNGGENLSPPTDEEHTMLGDEVGKGYRLACQVTVKGPVEVQQ